MNFLLPFRATDANGAPISGAKLYFYDAGTANLQDTYSDEDLTVPNANPVVADSAGWFGLIYGKRQTYKIKLTDASGVEIWTKDNVDPATLNAGDGITALGRLVVTPFDYGAAGDGATDDSVAVQSALSASVAVVDLCGKTFKCNTGLTIGANKTLRNGTLDFSGCASTNLIDAAGSAAAPVSWPGVSSLPKGTATIAWTTHGFQVGQWLFFFDPAFSHSGELTQVLAVPDADHFTLAWPTESSYGLVGGPQAIACTLLSGVLLKDLSIICNPATVANSATIRLAYCLNPRVEHVTVSGARLSGVKVTYTYGAMIDGCVFVNSDTGASGSASGVRVDNAARNTTIANSTCKRFNYGVNINPAITAYNARWTKIQNVQVDGCLCGVFAGQYSQHTRVHGLVCRGMGTTTTATGIDTRGADFQADDVDIQGDIQYGVLAASIGAADVSDCSLSLRNIRVYGASAYGIYVNAGEYVDVLIENVRISSPNLSDTPAIKIAPAVVSAGTRNIIRISGGDVWTDDSNVAHSAVEIVGQDATTKICISNLHVRAGDSGFPLNINGSASHVLVHGCQLDCDTTNVGSTCLKVDAVSGHVLIAGCTMLGGDYSITANNAGAGLQGLADGCVFEGNGTGPITGNGITLGDYKDY